MGAIGAWTDQLLKALNVATGTLAAVFVPVAAAWIALAAFLGRRQRAMAGPGVG